MRESLFLGLKIKMKNIDRRAEKCFVENCVFKNRWKRRRKILSAHAESVLHMLEQFSCVFLKNKGYFCQINSIYHRDDLLLELTVEQRELSS